MEYCVIVACIVSMVGSLFWMQFVERLKEKDFSRREQQKMIELLESTIDPEWKSADREPMTWYQR